MKRRDCEHDEGDDDEHPQRARTVLLTEDSPANVTPPSRTGPAWGQSFCVRADASYALHRPLGGCDVRPHHEAAPDKRRVKLLLVRHAESLANVDTMIHTKLSDHVIPLSDVGVEQAKDCGEFVRSWLLAQSGDVSRRRIIVSPYKRARDTGELITSTCWSLIGDMTENMMLGEQQFGLFGREHARVFG